MQYPGGKGQVGKAIASLINTYSTEREYIEPFCGMCSVAQHIVAKRRILLDCNPEVIALWRALQNGFIPPEDVSEAEYKRIKQDLSIDPALRAFVGFGCSFAGKYFGGFARNTKGDNYAKRASVSLRNKIATLRTAEFLIQDYRDFVPNADSVIYADPPYENTTQAYGNGSSFDSTEFWCKMTDWSKTCMVLVSSYTAPANWSVIWEKTKGQNMATKEQREGKTRTERVFVLKSL